MSDHYLDNLLPDFGEYSLDSLLDGYRDRAAAKTPEGQPDPDQPAKAAEAIAQRSRQIVMEALGETISQRRPAPRLDFDTSGLADLLGDDEPEAAEAEEPQAAPESEEPKKSRVHIAGDGTITVDLDLDRQDEAPEEEDEPLEEPDQAPREARRRELHPGR